MYYSNGYVGTALSCAANHGHDHIVKFLLSRDASCDGSYAELKVLCVSPFNHKSEGLGHSHASDVKNIGNSNIFHAVRLYGGY